MMNEWKEILYAAADHLDDIRSMGITEIALPPRDPAMLAAPRSVAAPNPASAVASPPPVMPNPEARRASASAPSVERAAQSTAGPEGIMGSRGPLSASGRNLDDGPSRPAAEDISAADALAQLTAGLAGCRLCRLSEGRRTIVAGGGNPQARIMFVGDAPNGEEDRTGTPLGGEAGKLLSNIIGAMGLTPADVYVTGVVKCRTPNDRTPMLDEVESCFPYLRRQIAAVKPEVIVALGAAASQALLNTSLPIMRLRGEFHAYDNIPVMPTFHPSYLLRNPEQKREVWADIQKVMGKLNLPLPKR